MFEPPVTSDRGSWWYRTQGNLLSGHLLDQREAQRGHSYKIAEMESKCKLLEFRAQACPSGSGVTPAEGMYCVCVHVFAKVGASLGDPPPHHAHTL